MLARQALNTLSKCLDMSKCLHSKSLDKQILRTTVLGRDQKAKSDNRARQGRAEVVASIYLENVGLIRKICNLDCISRDLEFLSVKFSILFERKNKLLFLDRL